MVRCRYVASVIFKFFEIAFIEADFTVMCAKPPSLSFISHKFIDSKNKNTAHYRVLHTGKGVMQPI